MPLPCERFYSSRFEYLLRTFLISSNSKIYFLGYLKLERKRERKTQTWPWHSPLPLTQVHRRRWQLCWAAFTSLFSTSSSREALSRQWWDTHDRKAAPFPFSLHIHTIPLLLQAAVPPHQFLPQKARSISLKGAREAPLGHLLPIANCFLLPNLHLWMQWFSRSNAEIASGLSPYHFTPSPWAQLRTSPSCINNWERSSKMHSMAYTVSGFL